MNKYAKAILFLIILFVIFANTENRWKKTEKQDKPIITTPHQREYLMRQFLKKLSRIPRLIFNLPAFGVIDNEALLQRAETLCGDSAFGLASINNAVGNPEMALDLCLQINDYMCAFNITYKNMGELPEGTKYDPVTYLWELYIKYGAEERNFFVADRFNDLGHKDIAEWMYKQAGVRHLLDYYVRENRIEDGKRLLETSDIDISRLARHGKLKEWGYYQDFVERCKTQIDMLCLEYLDDRDITRDYLEAFWYIDMVEDRSLARAIVARTAKRTGVFRHYYDEYRESIIQRLRDGKDVDYSAITQADLYDDIVSYLEQYNVNPYTLAQLAQEYGYNDRAIKAYEKGTASDAFNGALFALRDYENEQMANDLFELYLKKMDSMEEKDILYMAFANNMLHNFEEAMRLCEIHNQVLGEQCACATSVIKHLYEHARNRDHLNRDHLMGD